MGDHIKSTSVRTDREVVEAFDPSGGTLQLALTWKRMRAEAKKGEWAVLEMTKILPEILKSPKAIFEGIRWDEDEDREVDADGWRCYVGIPKLSFDKDGKQGAPWKDEVYLVFVNADGVVYNWRWEDCDSDNTTVPHGYVERFCKQVWPI